MHFLVNSVCVCPDLDPQGNSQRKCVNRKRYKKKEKERNPAFMARGPFTNSVAFYLQRPDSTS